MTRRLSFPALALALSGCAVATVDVDVYKGPLANHDDVQVEQMAVMATSAKPILLRLREVVAPEGAYDQLRGQGVDLSGYVPPRASGKSQFATENDPAAADAERVNAILYLYQDRRGADDPLTLAAISAVQDYKQARAILTTPQIASLAPRIGNRPAFEGFVGDNEKTKNLRAGYANFLFPKYIPANETLPPRDPNHVLEEIKDLSYGRGLTLESLSRRAPGDGPVEKHARILFGNDYDTKRDNLSFIASVHRLVGAWRDAESSLHRLYRLNLRRLQRAGRDTALKRKIARQTAPFIDLKRFQEFLEVIERDQSENRNLAIQPQSPTLLAPKKSPFFSKNSLLFQETFRIFKKLQKKS